jgi:chemotaxis family two-component system response regulator Rcp1
MKDKGIVEVLIVDDNPADQDLTRDALARGRCPSHVRVANDGLEALQILRGEGRYAEVAIPDLIVLDLNLPGKDGRAVLSELKADPVFRATPVIIFSTSEAGHDIRLSYELGANCYITKPGDLHGFVAAVTTLSDYWFGCARLPRREEK